VYLFASFLPKINQFIIHPIFKFPLLIRFAIFQHKNEVCFVCYSQLPGGRQRSWYVPTCLSLGCVSSGKQQLTSSREKHERAEENRREGVTCTPQKGSYLKVSELMSRSCRTCAKMLGKSSVCCALWLLLYSHTHTLCLLNLVESRSINRL
jgi:hypothetical protein